MRDLHARAIASLDIKPETIVLNSDFSEKIADLGSPRPTSLIDVDL
jgi:serine/threonine protein kinase